jgi:ankyrin repeat protein
MQNGVTLAHAASLQGHTETLALLLANKADINAAAQVQQFNIFKYLYLIDKELQGYHFVCIHVFNDFST